MCLLYVFILLIITIIIISLILLCMKTNNKIGGGIEFEKRYYGFDYNETKQKILAGGFKNTGNYLFTVTKFDSRETNKTIRIRDEGHRITFTIKLSGGQFDEEHEVNVSDYHEMIKMIELLGYREQYTMQKYREIFQKDNTEIIFDHFPGCNPYIEIESLSEQLVDEYAQKFDLIENKKIGLKMLWKEQGIDGSDKSFTFKSLLDNNDICNDDRFKQKILEQIKIFDIKI